MPAKYCRRSPAAAVLPPRGPFDLLFTDGGWRDPAGLGALLALVRVGDRVVMDDVTPIRLLPAGSPLRRADAKREFIFGTPVLLLAEVAPPDLRNSRNSLLVGTGWPSSHRFS